MENVHPMTSVGESYSLKKQLITLLSYFLWKVMRYVTFELLFKSGQGLLVCFNIKTSSFTNIKALSHQK